MKNLRHRATLKGDYFLFLDADMKLVVTSKFDKRLLNHHNAHSIIQKSHSLNYFNLRFVKTKSKVTCKGVTHEYYDVPEGDVSKIDDSVIYIDDIGDGGAKGDKTQRDIRLLTEGISDGDTSNDLKGRYYFYRANTYFDSNQHELAIEDYKKRIEIGGWVEEVWYSKYRIGLALERLGRINDATIAHLHAYQHHPKRAEPLYELTRIYRILSNHNISYAFYKLAKEIPYPENDVLFINRNIYSHLLDYELSVIGYYVGVPNIDKLVVKLLNNEGVNLNFQHMMSNYKFYSKNIPTIKVLDFTDNTLFKGFSSSTPCIISSSNKGYQLYIRHHNYRINADGSYSSGEKITSNYSVNILDSNLAKKSSFAIEEPMVTELRYTGIEDVKFFPHKSSLCFMGTAQNPENKDLLIAFGKRDIGPTNSRLEYTFVKSPENRRCEKNWAFFSEDDKTLKVVYEWNKFKTYTVGDDYNLLDGTSNEKTPKFFEHLRGSTNGSRSGDYIWFLCHLVSFEPHRSYYHVFVIYNTRTKNFVYTVPFKFEGKNVEYALGLIVEDARLLVSYSTGDNCSKVAVIEKKEVCKLFA